MGFFETGLDRVQTLRPSDSNKLSGQGTGMLIVLQDCLTADDSRLDASAELLQAFRTARQVIHDLGHQRADLVRIKRHDVGSIQNTVSDI